MFGFFPTNQADIESTLTISHVVGLSLLQKLANICLETGAFSVIFQICDKRVAGVYITLLATISNLTAYLHKLYLFWAVDKFGLYWTQGVISVLAFSFAIYVRKEIYKMDALSKESWAVSDKVLQKIKNT